MPTPLPDCTLESLRLVPSPGPLRRAFLREAARACARHVREGGRLGEIRPELSRVRNGRLELHPLPAGGRGLFPDRRRLEADLLRLQEDWRGAVPDDRARLVFLMDFSRRLAEENPVWPHWARGWVSERQREVRQRIRYRYQALFHECRPPPGQTFNGTCALDPALPLEGLHALLDQAMREGREYLSHSRRADVATASLMGREVVIKRFTANPRLWRRRWEVSRARRAWVGSRVLRETGLNGAPPVAWLERRENGRLVESFFVCGLLPARENARAWLRRVLPGLTREERILLRHRLRGEIIHLQQHALCHIDLKLPNLLVEPGENGRPVFYWIDLEDIRSGRASFRTIIRNFYQLNGSLPRQVTRKERLAFARGFRKFHPLATHPLVLRYVERKTRKRMRSELRRATGV